MQAWDSPSVPHLDVAGPEVQLFNTATRSFVLTEPDGHARLYVCGITPYDATHLGHANTYVAFDVLQRAWRAAGHEVVYVQNVTDVDDPLLERATKVGIDWQVLAERETQLFRDDMTALRVLPPTHYAGVVESIPLVIDMIGELDKLGAVYRVDSDLYFSVSADPKFGDESGLSQAGMLALFAERGGDPQRPGKRDPLDALLWRAERPGEPSWPSPFGPGRPGWHIECSAIALQYLGMDFTVQGGGSDLIFPHHEMSAGHAQVLHAGQTFAEVYAHAGMVAYDGEKMSKSRGNLVFVSALRNSGVDPMVIRYALMRHHYREDWEWTDYDLWQANDVIKLWREAVSRSVGAPTGEVIETALAALANDLNTPVALGVIQEWVVATLGGHTEEAGAGARIGALLDASLGLQLLD